MFLKYIYLRIIFEKLFTVMDGSNDKLISRDEFAKSSFVLDKLGLAGLKFEDMDLDGSGEITLQEMMHVVIKNIETLELNSGDLKLEEEELKEEIPDPNIELKEEIPDLNLEFKSPINKHEYENANLKSTKNKLEYVEEGNVKIIVFKNPADIASDSNKKSEFETPNLINPNENSEKTKNNLQVVNKLLD